jgi:general stress protein CsbA
MLSYQLLLFQFVLPISVNILCGLLVLIILKPRMRICKWIAFILSTLALFACLLIAYLETPKLVIVPDCLGYSGHRAFLVCESTGLKPKIEGGPYGSRANEVMRQSLRPGLEVFRGEVIILTVYRGEPVSYQITKKPLNHI